MLTRLVFNFIMIEFATGVAFLVTSLYAPASAVNASTTAQAATSTQSTTVASTQSLSTSSEIAAYVHEQYKDEPILVDIARCESTYRQYGPDGNILRGKVNHDDVGVMQINEKYHADEALKLGYDIYSVKGNVAFGKYLYEKSGAQPWSSSSKCWSAPSGEVLAQR